MHRPQADSSTESYAGPSGVPPSSNAAGGAPPPPRSLAAHLELIDRGEESRLSAERYADALATVARSLGELHERGLVQGNIRPERLSFDVDSGQIELPPPALGRGGDAPLPAGDPYVAPEQHLGEEGPSVDQYAFGVLARDVFTARAAPPPTASLRDVLRQGTAPRPEDRYPDLAAFGEALAAAVRGEAPRGLADRIEAMDARSRASMAPGALMAALILLVALGDARDPLMGPYFTAVLAPAAAGAAGALVGFLVRIAAAIRRASWPCLAIAARPWAPIAAIAAIFAAILASGGEVTGKGFEVIVGVYAARALLAPPPDNAAGLLVGLLRRWDTRRTLASPRRQAVSVGAPAAVVAILLAPVVVGTLWPISFDMPSIPAPEYPPLVTVASFRAALGNDEYRYACRELMTREAAAPPRLCPNVLRWAAVVQLNDPATEAPGLVLGERGALERFGVQELPRPGEGRSWLIRAADGERESGAMYTEGSSERRITVLLSRLPPAPRGSELRSLWLYETVQQSRGWRIAGFRACEIGPGGSGRQDARCLARNSLSAARVKALLAMLDRPARP